MKKIFLLFIGVLLSATFVVNAQSIGSSLRAYYQSQKNLKGGKSVFDDKLDIKNIQGKEYISLIIRVDRKSDLSFLKKYDCKVHSRIGRIVTMIINVKDLEKLTKDNNIIELDASIGVNPALLKDAVKDLNMADVWAGNGLNQPYTGKDVIVGVADWGIDYTHPTFYDSTGNNYRILAAWDQFRKQGPAPEGFDYGTEIVGQQALLEAQCDTANQYDTNYHSTHVGGIAAGSGAGTQYKGLAYDANLIFCTWTLTLSDYIDAIVWMRDFAKKANKRLVINNSWGVYCFGYMNGESMLDEAINTMSDEDSVVFVVSAGNNGDAKFHLQTEFNAQDTIKQSEIEFQFQKYDVDTLYRGEIVTLQSENGTDFSTKISVYDYAWNLLAESDYMNSNGSDIEETTMIAQDDTIIYRAFSRYPEDNIKIVDWEIYQKKVVANTNHVVLTIKANEGIVHAWNVNRVAKAIGNTGFDFRASQEGFLEGNNEYGVSEPGLAEKVITVAAHRYKKGQWDPTIANFSSRGPNMTSYLKPEISAPGYSIVSSVNSFSSADATAKIGVTFNGKEYHFISASGTSMSAPMVTGSVAIMLEANNKLSPQEIKEIIEQTAKTDEYTGECPNYTWGYGKLNTWAAVQKAEQKVSLNEIKDENISIYPIPATDFVAIEGVEENSKIELFDILGRNIKTTKLSGKTLDIKDIPSGTYIIKIESDGVIKICEIIKK